MGQKSTIKVARARPGLRRGEDGTGPPLSQLAGNLRTVAICLALGHDPVPWYQCPSMLMCWRCHTSFVEVQR